MKIRFPKKAGSYAKGRVIEVTRAQASLFIKAGLAVPYDESAPVAVDKSMERTYIDRAIIPETGDTETRTLSRRALRRRNARASTGADQ